MSRLRHYFLFVLIGLAFFLLATRIFVGSFYSFWRPSKFEKPLRQFKVVESVELKLAKVLQEYMYFSNSFIWKQHNISKDTPFIFLHQRKAGGTSLRFTLNNATNTTGMKSFIPCYNKVHCETFSIPSELKYEVYALHTNWSNIENMMISSNLSTTNGTYGKYLRTANNESAMQHSRKIIETKMTKIVPIERKKVHFSCMTNFREPIARLSSCVYFRFKDYFLKRNFSCINDMSVQRFTKLIVERKDIYNNSCLNEPFRVLSNLPNEDTVTSLGYTYNSTTYEVQANTSITDVVVLRDALHNLRYCVPIILELHNSRELLRNAFPSLYEKNAFDARAAQQVRYDYSKHCSVPDEAHMNVMRQVTQLERILYHTVKAKIKSALQEFNISTAIVTSHNNSSNSSISINAVKCKCEEIDFRNLTLVNWRHKPSTRNTTTIYAQEQRVSKYWSLVVDQYTSSNGDNNSSSDVLNNISMVNRRHRNTTAAATSTTQQEKKRASKYWGLVDRTAGQAQDNSNSNWSEKDIGGSDALKTRNVNGRQKPSRNSTSLKGGSVNKGESNYRSMFFGGSGSKKTKKKSGHVRSKRESAAVAGGTVSNGDSSAGDNSVFSRGNIFSGGSVVGSGSDIRDSSSSSVSGGDGGDSTSAVHRPHHAVKPRRNGVTSVLSNLGKRFIRRGKSPPV